MARMTANIWQKHKFNLNALVLLAVMFFLYQALFPTFPDAWPAKDIGEFNVVPMPYNSQPPYLHDGVYSKDFFITFKRGQVKNIRQAYLAISEHPIPLSQLQAGEYGILHGSQHAQEAHAIAPKQLTSQHRLWLTIQSWSGEIWFTSWLLSEDLLN